MCLGLCASPRPGQAWPGPSMETTRDSWMPTSRLIQVNCERGSCYAFTHTAGTLFSESRSKVMVTEHSAGLGQAF